VPARDQYLVGFTADRGSRAHEAHRLSVVGNLDMPVTAITSDDTERPVRVRDRAIRQRSCLRDVMPSLVKTLPRCHSTVRGLMNS
jgi:hypothetical protein